jgi:hypothetical protein
MGVQRTFRIPALSLDVFAGDVVGDRVWLTIPGIGFKVPVPLDAAVEATPTPPTDGTPRATVEIPLWRGNIGAFHFGGHPVEVDVDSGGVQLHIDHRNVLGMSAAQSERLGVELIAAARASKAGA